MTKIGTILIASIAFLAANTKIEAAEILVLCSGAMKAVVRELVPEIEKRTGHKAPGMETQ